jgi:diaminohydroxyphosphoribosylaminopyrimidine deaminase/5-amino-6-(5-phosphoribosylamino)uracil reductase
MDQQGTTGDRAFMLQALRLAATASRRPWPNPPVGAVVVNEGVVIGRGTHEGCGQPHAEAVALAEAGDRARGATLYCTLEPCNHTGRMPPCAPLVAESGIARLVIAVRDPNPHVAGGGVHLLRDAGIEVDVGICAAEALDLVWPFVVTRGFERPFVWLKTAVSTDGFFAPAGMVRGQGPFYITGEQARCSVHVLRRWADIVLVGSRTASIDNPRLDGRMASDGPCPSEEPLPAFVSATLAGATPWVGRHHIAFAGRRAPGSAVAAVEAAGGTVVRCDEDDGGVKPASVVAAAARLGKSCLLVEGGPSLAFSFLRAGLVDRWVHFTAPIALGEGVRWPQPALGAEAVGRPAFAEPHGFTLTRSSHCGVDLVEVRDREPFQATCEALAETGGPNSLAEPADACPTVVRCT